METDLIQDGSQVKRQTDIDHHGPKYILIICHLPEPLFFHYPLPLKGFYMIITPRSDPYSEY
jgi:hypothetical protein